jgi:enoyl-CoA hydratase
VTRDDAPAPARDWLGSEYLCFERHGRTARVTVDRRSARNAMTPAMYFGVRYAIDRVNRAPELDGLLITGTGDVFIPGAISVARATTTGWTSTCWGWR